MEKMLNEAMLIWIPKIVIIVNDGIDIKKSNNHKKMVNCYYKNYINKIIGLTYQWCVWKQFYK
jgi:hypothetical protein